MSYENMGKLCARGNADSLQARHIPHCRFTLVRVGGPSANMEAVGRYSRMADAKLDREWFAANDPASLYLVIERA